MKVGKSTSLNVLIVLSLAFLGSGLAGAAIELDGVSSANDVGAEATLSFSHSVGVGDNRILVVGLAAEDPSPADMTVSSVTYGGASMTLVGGSTVTVGSVTLMRTDLYFLVAPPVGSDTVTVTYAGNVSNRNAGAVSLRGAAQQGPESVATNWNTSLSNITTNIATLSDGAWVVDVVGCGDSGHLFDTAGDMSERWDVGYGGPSSSTGAGSTKPVATVRVTTVGWQFSYFSAVRMAHSVATFAPAAEEPSYGTGDLNGDTVVDWQDLGLFAEQWLDSGCSGPNCADLDGMNGVNWADFAILVSNWIWLGGQTGLVINEFMASNSNVIADEQGDYDDWIEVYNGTDSAVDIGGMYVTDDLNEPSKWQIPDDAPAETTIAAGEYLLLWADDDEADGPLHLPFQLSKSGEDVGLYEADGNMVDGLSYGEQVGDVSYGRFPDGNDVNEPWLYMGIPTPGTQNSDGYAGVVEEVEISHVHGFYDSVFEVELYCEDGDAEIWYTVDGNTPDADTGTGTVYNPAVRIQITGTTCLRAAAFKPGYKGSVVNTATYIFLNDVKTQSDGNAYSRGFPVNWEDRYGSWVVGDYGMDPEVIIDDPTYSSAFEGAMKSIPTISLVTDMKHLFSPQTGIYSNPWEYHVPEEGRYWERPVSVEYIDPCTADGFQVNAGLRIVGNQSRTPDLNYKHSLRVFFKGEFGPSELEFPLFENTGADRLNNLSLRADYHWSWLDMGRAYEAQYLRDTFAQDSFRDMGYLSPDSRFVHVYIDGLYWGVYQASERSDDAFLAEHLGGEREEYDIIEGVIRGRMEEGDAFGGVELKAGEQDTWDYMWSILDGYDFGRPISAEDYDQLQYYLDVAAFCDYIVYNAFVSNWDWGAKNWYAGSTRGDVNESPATLWTFYTWDAEISMLSPQNHHSVPFGTYTGWGPGYIHNRLHGNAEYNRLLGDHIHKLLFNDGRLAEQKSIDRYEVRAEQIEEAILGESGRWGDFVQDFKEVTFPVFTPAYWDNERDRMVNPEHPTSGWYGPYFPNRTSDAIGKFRADGSYPSASYPAPEFSQQGGEISAGGAVTVTGSGTIYYTTDGSEPMDYGTTGSSVPINHSLTLKARADFGSGNWSALNEATFAVGDLAGDLRITEIMYHPYEAIDTDPEDPNEEFIELRNIGGSSVNLNLVKFTEGIDFTFGDMTLAAGQHVLVVKNITAFEAKYGGGLNIAGEWTGPREGVLSNAGERIRVEDAIGRTILDFSYADGWRRVTDGDGFSLNIVDENADANLWGDKANWAASTYKGGTPGSDDSGLLAEHSIAINEVLAHTDVAPQDWIELKNTTSGSIDISGWYLSDSDEDLLKYQIAPGTSIGAGNYLVLTEDDDFGVAFALSEYGETVYLTSSDGSILTGYREQEDFGASENGVSFGRHLKSTLTYNFVAMSSTTYDIANAYPAVGPIVINEIMYNPASGGQNEEYIELHNITGNPVLLSGWKFTDGIKYEFGGVSIPGNGYLLVVKTDPAYFTGTLYSVPGGIAVLGPYEGRLSNGGEKLELSKPGDLDGLGQQTYIRVDRVVYSDGSHPDNPWESDPWPSSPDAGGDSLSRKVGSDYGNDIANWHAATPSPGAVNY